MKYMTELAGGELSLPQRPHNQVGAARRIRKKRIINKRIIEANYICFNKTIYMLPSIMVRCTVENSYPA